MILITDLNETDLIPILKKIYNEAYYDYIRKNTINR